MRLIDADAFAEKIKEVATRQGYYDFYPKHISVGEILYSVITELNGEGVCGFENAPTVDAVPWEFLERYAEWFCATVSFPEFIREAKQFYLDAERYERWCNK